MDRETANQRNGNRDQTFDRGPIAIDVTKKNRRQLIAFITLTIVWSMFVLFFSISGYSLVNYMSKLKTPTVQLEPMNRKPLILTVTSDNGTAIEVMLNPMEELLYLVSNHEQLAPRNLTSEFLQRFLMARKNDPDKALKLVLGYFRMRKEHPEFFMKATESLKNVEPPLFYFQKERGPNGEPLAYSNMGNWDYKRHKYSYAMAAITPFVEIGTIENVNNSRQGATTVVDMSGWTWWHSYYASGSDGKLIFELTESALPTMPGRTHICRESRIVSLLFTLFKPFMSKEMASKIMFHGNDFESLYQYIPKSSLPIVLGGDKNLSLFSMQEAERIDKVLDQYYKQWPTEI